MLRQKYETIIVGQPKITSLRFEILNLICISTGGPATTVVWSRNSDVLQMGSTYRGIQIIVDKENATYMNILQSNDAANLVGNFTCSVCNAGGSDTKSASNNGI